MKKGMIALIAVGAIILLGFLAYYNAYNNAVGLQETVDEKWGNVQSAYQRRLDLIPNLMKTVKASAKNEKEILTQVTQARSGIVEAKTPKDMEIMGKKINTAINLTYEAYPNIQSTQNFRDFQVQLEGTENRIKRERDVYNEAVKKLQYSYPRILHQYVSKQGNILQEGHVQCYVWGRKNPRSKF